MKKKIQINPSIIFAAVLLTLVLSNCDKTPDNTDDQPARPTASTDTVSSVSETWATISGWVKAGNLLTKIYFEYDTDVSISGFRNEIPANPDTLTGNSSIRRTVYLADLMPNTTYYYRIKAVNSLGETLGLMREFTTLDVDTSSITFNLDLTYEEISDIEGNVYKTIQIGDQIWMAQNLAVAQYNDGEEIPLVTATTEWYELESGAYSWYGGTETRYGALYNWYAVSSDKLCPAGWRVPTDDDWTILTDYLDGVEVAGGKLKEAGSVHWTVPNVGASNSSGFTALPGGYRSSGGGYNNSKRLGYWWTSSSNPLFPDDGNARSLNYSYAEIDKVILNKRIGASVRCIKE